MKGCVRIVSFTGAFLLTCMGSVSLYASTGTVSFVTVRMRAPSNSNPRIWYRVPCDYRATPGRTWRTLVIFGGRNCGGSNEVSNTIGWAKWADDHGVFLVAPGFKDDSYWEPQRWSGRALLDALAEIKRSYAINTSKLLYYGYSAGSQASNLFAAWRPDLCRAWVSHACGVFHTPSARMRNAPGLVTCGDADTARDILSRDFVAKARMVGQPVIWKSFPNHPHDVPPGSLALARAFLTHHDERYSGDLGYAAAKGFVAQSGTGRTGFVGDDPEGLYWPMGSAEAAAIPPDDRVVLPSRAVAEAWGREGLVTEDASGRVSSPRASTSCNPWPFAIDSVQLLCRVPAVHSPTSRIAVLFGGRGWPAEKTLSAFNFDAMADTNGVFLLSPSFVEGEYWRPETGTGRILRRALDTVRSRYDLKPLPVILYGYSAGGQCAALFAEFLKGDVLAWGVYGCGVFPETDSPPLTPALVTCGVDDEERLRISRQFAYRRREARGQVIWRMYTSGHVLDPAALELARAWIAAFANGNRWPRVWGEDDTFAVRPSAQIDIEFRNPLYTEAVERAWR